MQLSVDNGPAIHFRALRIVLSSCICGVALGWQTHAHMHTQRKRDRERDGKKGTGDRQTHSMQDRQSRVINVNSPRSIRREQRRVQCFFVGAARRACAEFSIVEISKVCGCDWELVFPRQTDRLLIYTGRSISQVKGRSYRRNGLAV